VYEQKTNTKGSAIMSVLLKAPIKKTGLITKTKHVGPKTSSILLVSAGIFIVVVLLMYAGIASTDGAMKGPDQFKLALSYCDPK